MGAQNYRVTRGFLHSLMTFDAFGAVDLLGDTPLYDTEPFVGQAVSAVVHHLNRYLGAPWTETA